MCVPALGIFDFTSCIQRQTCRVDPSPHLLFRDPVSERMLCSIPNRRRWQQADRPPPLPVDTATLTTYGLSSRVKLPRTMAHTPPSLQIYSAMPLISLPVATSLPARPWKLLSGRLLKVRPIVARLLPMILFSFWIMLSAVMFLHPRRRGGRRRRLPTSGPQNLCRADCFRCRRYFAGNAR